MWNTGDYWWVSIGDMKDGENLLMTKETVSTNARSKIFKSAPSAPGTILMSFKLTIGKICRLGVPAYHNEAIISVSPLVAEIDPYLFQVLPDCARRGNFKAAVKGATLNRKSLAGILVPLPPIAEQHRIVAKVNEFLATIAQLATSIRTTQDKRNRLMESLLDEALEIRKQETV